MKCYLSLSWNLAEENMVEYNFSLLNTRFFSAG